MTEPPVPGDGFVDTHVHVTSADVARFARQPTGVGSEWWSGTEGHAANVLDAARTAGAAAVVVVQAVGAYGYDSSCAAAAVDEASGFARLVTAIDMSGVGRSGVDRSEPPASSEPHASAEPHASSGPHASWPPAPCAGWRLFGVADGAPWLSDGRADLVFEAAATHDVVVVPTVFTEHLPKLRAVAERHRTVDIALDHCAFPDMGGDDAERRLFELVEIPTIRLKVTTHVLAAWQREHRLDAMFERLVEAFGADRLCWGSDHPQHQGLSYDGKLELARRAARNLSVVQRRQFFSGTAIDLRWAPA